MIWQFAVDMMTVPVWSAQTQAKNIAGADGSNRPAMQLRVDK
jgi:hypothetical protein